MKKPTLKHILQFSAVLSFLIMWSVLMYAFEPETLVKNIGIGNGYLIGFFVTLFAGLSAFTSPAFFTTVGTLIFGGLNPYILGFLIGIALFIGDSVFFFLGDHGRKIFLNEKSNGKFHKLSNWLRSKPKWVILVVVFLYLGFSPFPNDVLMIALSVIGFKYRDIFIALVLGSMVFGFVVTGVFEAFS